MRRLRWLLGKLGISAVAQPVGNEFLQRLHLDRCRSVSRAIQSKSNQIGWNLGLLGNLPYFHVLELDARVFLYLGDQDQGVEVILFLLDLLLLDGKWLACELEGMDLVVVM